MKTPDRERIAIAFLLLSSACAGAPSPAIPVAASLTPGPSPTRPAALSTTAPLDTPRPADILTPSISPSPEPFPSPTVMPSPTVLPGNEGGDPSSRPGVAVFLSYRRVDYF